MSFARLARTLGQERELWLAELPGRGTRSAEVPKSSLPELVQEFAEALAEDPRPLELYGHSLGGLLAFEVALAWKADASSLQRLVVSCVRAPGLIHGPAPLRGIAEADWTDELLLQALKRYGEIPAALASGEARAFFLPLFRQDFSLVKNYLPSAGQVKCPFLALAGAADLSMSPPEVKDWQRFAAGPFLFREVPGGHFCVLEQPQILQGVFSEEFA